MEAVGLERLAAPTLRRAHDDIELVDLAELIELDLPMLEGVGRSQDFGSRSRPLAPAPGVLRLVGLPRLGDLPLPALQRVFGGLHLEDLGGSDRTAALSLPNLEVVGDWWCGCDRALGRLRYLWRSSPEFEQSWTLCAQASGGLRVQETGFSTLELPPGVEVLGPLTLVGNEALPQCEAEELAAGVVGIGSRVVGLNRPCW